MLDYTRIRNIKYDLACIDGCYGVISKDFENKDSRVSRTMRQLCITHMKDMLILNQDRNKSNWVIEENEKEANLVPDFDHGETFKDENWSSLHINPLGEKYIGKNNTYIELEKFIKWSDKSTYKVLEHLKSKLGMDNLDIAIKKVEEKIGVPIHEDTKEEIRESFKKHQIKLDEIIEKDNER